MKITIFEGTPEEYQSVAGFLGKNAEVSSEGAKELISHKDAYRAMLMRRSIKEGQRKLYKTLADGYLKWSVYLERMGRTEEQIRGIHGALGRRINQTPEIHAARLPGSLDAVIDWSRDGANTIGLNPEFLEVLKEMKLV
jgi:hypothetical protein